MIDLPGRYAFVDVETTGGSPGRDRVIEIAIAVLEDGEIINEWSSLVDPGCPIPPTITGLTGIDDAMVAGAPTFAGILDEVHERLDGRVFTAHNVRFDFGFLRHEFQRAGVALRARQLCTVRLSRALYPQHRGHGLDAIIARFGLTCDGRHRALGDVHATIGFVRAALAGHGSDTVAAAIARQLQGPALPPRLPPENLEALPEGPGVYLFHGDNDALLYVGKSNNLRARVLSHFAGDHRSDKATRIAQTVTRVDWVETAGELGALLQEARLIKERQPLHNRRLRRSGTQVLVSLEEAADGYLRTHVIAADAPRAHVQLPWFGPYTSARAARRRLERVAGEHGLCPRRLGLEAGSGGPCFARQLQRCRGACTGDEPAVQYNLRLLEALGPDRIRPWPWSGPIVVREAAAAAARPELHVADRWCYLGSASEPVEAEALAEAPLVFDRDYYRLLLRWLQRHPGKARPLHAPVAAQQASMF